MKEGWEKKKLGDIAEIISGKNQKKVENPSGKYPICGSGGIMGYADEYLCPAGTTIIGRKGTINKPLYIDTPFWNVDTAFGISPNKEHNSRFVFYLCKKIDWLKYNKSTTLPSLVKTDIQNITIPVPSLSVQESIVSELDMLSGIISKHKALQEEYDRLEQSIFYDMFGDPVTNEKGWEVKKLGEVFSIGSGGTPSKTNPDYWNGGTIPWIGSNMCQNCIIYETDGKYITEEGLNHSSAKLLDKDTVLVALVGATIGKVALLKTETATNQNIAFIRKHKDFEPLFVFYHMMSLYPEFMNIGNGDFKMASQGFIKGLTIPLPPLSFQQSFADKISAIEQMKAKNKAAQEEAEMLFNERMAYYF